MRALCAGLLLASLVTTAQAGPLLDRLRERTAQSGEDASTGAVSLPAGARKLGNVSYGPDPAQTFDVYLPAGASQAPVIFMVHGGAWSIGDKSMGRVIDAKLARWVSRGFILVSINYRMLPQAAPDVQLQDVAQALATAQGMAARWGGDARRFILMGHSAGAHLLALLAAAPAKVTAKPLPVLGTVLLDSAAMDLVAIMGHRHYRLYDRPFGNDPAYWRAMSPILALTPGAAPMLAVCSSRRDDSCAQARAFADQAARLGIRTQVLSEALSHGEINSQLGLDTPYTHAVEAFMGSLDAEVAHRLP